MKAAITRYFSLDKKGTSINIEVMAGLTTFMTMAYIILVNPSVLAEAGMDQKSLAIVTCLVSAIATILMGLFPKVPIAMAPGMGLNAFFAYTIVLSEGIPWEVALGMVFWAGVLFFLMAFWGLREKIVKVIPPALVVAISVGIGLFILFIGAKNMGLIVDHPAKLVSLGTFDQKVFVGLGGLFLTIVLYIRKNPAAIFVGIAFSTLLSIFMGLVEAPSQWILTEIDISPVAFKVNLIGALKWSLLPTIFILFYVDMFDTIGTLVACSREAGLVKENGQIREIRKMMGVDAVATMLSGLLGTSPTTSYIESGAGIVAGGKTGLTSVTTGLLFLLAVLFAPLLVIVPVYATAPALMMVGFIMIEQVKHIDFKDYEESIPAMITFVFMPLTFSISTGLACGFIAWGFIKVLNGKAFKVHWLMYLIIVFSLASLIL